jgi:hypothetical protein
MTYMCLCVHVCVFVCVWMEEMEWDDVMQKDTLMCGWVGVCGGGKRWRGREAHRHRRSVLLV